MNSTHFLRKTTYLLHITNYDDSTCAGTIFDPTEQRYYQFHSLCHMILSLDALCEISSWPPREPALFTASFQNILQPVTAKPRHGDICSVLTDILYRQHGSMQGKATLNTSPGNAKKVCFRSELELMMLIHSACSSRKKKDLSSALQ